MSIFNIFALRQRLGAAMLVVAGAMACCVCGAVMSFGLAPRQQLDASRLSRLPMMSLGDVEAAEPGTTILTSGHLYLESSDSPDADGLVAYTIEAWEVSVIEDPESGDFTTGKWVDQEDPGVPEMRLELDGQSVRLLASDNVSLGGNLQEMIVEAEDGQAHDHEGVPLPHGSQRLEGIPNGMLVTVLGKKASVGGVVPEALFVGDRTSFESAEREAASGLFFSGLIAMALAPLVLIGGLLFLIFKR